MSTIRIRRTLDSDTLHLPELRPLIGRTVEIVVEEAPPRPGRRGRPDAGDPRRDRPNRITLAPGTPDSTEMLREDRER